MRSIITGRVPFEVRILERGLLKKHLFHAAYFKCLPTCKVFLLE